MPIEILMPALSPTMTEGNLAKWHKKEGDKIKPGDLIAEIETDKATMEVEAVDGGILGKIVIAEGSENVKVNSLIAILLENGESAASIANYKSSTSSKESKTEDLVQTKTISPAHEKQAANISTANENNKITKLFASPLAKRIAAQNNIDLTKIEGSGPHGRIVKSDLSSITTSDTKPKESTKIFTQKARNEELYNKIPISNVRKIIAKRLSESKVTAPHFYLSIDCDLDKLTAIRNEFNKTSEKNKGPKLSVNDFVIRASAKALEECPEANTSWAEDHILQYNNVDISVAVAIDGGLVTPIVRNANLKSVTDISLEMKDLAARARTGKLKPEEYQGGSFSISNLGMFGIKKFSAIINPPQGSILAVGAGTERVVVKDGQITKATIMDLTLSIDHRVIDGAVGAKFLSVFKFYIENPLLMIC